MIEFVKQSLQAVVLISPLYLYVSILSFRYHAVKSDYSEDELRQFLQNLTFLPRQIYASGFNVFIGMREKNSKSFLVRHFQRERIIITSIMGTALVIPMLFNVPSLLKLEIISIYNVSFYTGLLILLILSWLFGTDLQKKNINNPKESP